MFNYFEKRAEFQSQFSEVYLVHKKNFAQSLWLFWRSAIAINCRYTEHQLNKCLPLCNYNRLRTCRQQWSTTLCPYTYLDIQNLGAGTLWELNRFSVEGIRINRNGLGPFWSKLSNERLSFQDHHNSHHKLLVGKNICLPFPLNTQ